MAKVQFLLALVGSIGLQSGVAAVKPRPQDEICVNGAPCPATTVQARRAATFVDSIGVNVHFTQAQTAYVTVFSLVKEKLIALGVHHVRDGAVDHLEGGRTVGERPAGVELANKTLRRA